MKTPKAQTLGKALRNARTEHGMTLRALADKINRDAGLLSRWENAERTPKPTDVAQILTALGVSGEQYDAILSLASGTDDRQWLAVNLPQQRQHLAALLDFEQNATNITAVSPLLVPGLLQTGSYIRAIMSGGSLPPDEIATRAAIRLGRREVLSRSDPAQLLALIGEGALRQKVGGPAVMVEQLRHLLEMAERPNVDVRVIPFDRSWHPALEGAFTLIESDPMPVVQLENRRSGLFLHDDEDVGAYRQAVEMVLTVAMTPEKSARFVAEQLERLEGAR